MERVQVNSNWGVNKVTIYNCVIHNIWQRGIKGVMVPEKDREKLRPYDCRVQYCLFYNDRPKQLSDEQPDQFGGDYVGGMDIMYAKRWTISDNVFVGIHGRTAWPAGRSSYGSTPRTARSNETSSSIATADLPGQLSPRRGNQDP